MNVFLVLGLNVALGALIMALLAAWLIFRSSTVNLTGHGLDASGTPGVQKTPARITFWTAVVLLLVLVGIDWASWAQLKQAANDLQSVTRLAELEANWGNEEKNADGTVTKAKGKKLAEVEAREAAAADSEKKLAPQAKLTSDLEAATKRVGELEVQVANLNSQLNPTPEAEELRDKADAAKALKRFEAALLALKLPAKSGVPVVGASTYQYPVDGKLADLWKKKLTATDVKTVKYVTLIARDDKFVSASVTYETATGCEMSENVMDLNITFRQTADTADTAAAHLETTAGRIALTRRPVPAGSTVVPLLPGTVK